MFECKAGTFCNASQKTIFGMQNFVLRCTIFGMQSFALQRASVRSVVDCTVLFFMQCTMSFLANKEKRS